MAEWIHREADTECSVQWGVCVQGTKAWRVVHVGNMTSIHMPGTHGPGSMGPAPRLPTYDMAPNQCLNSTPWPWSHDPCLEINFALKGVSCLGPLLYTTDRWCSRLRASDGYRSTTIASQPDNTTGTYHAATQYIGPIPSVITIPSPRGLVREAHGMCDRSRPSSLKKPSGKKEWWPLTPIK